MILRPSVEQSEHLWRFAQGDLDPLKFEKWFLAERELDEVLGENLHWELASGSYLQKETLWQMRTAVREALSTLRSCECPTIRDLDLIPMGGEVDAQDRFRSDHVFATFEEVAKFGRSKWWLYISKCRECSTIWLIAQDERIYDNWYLARVDDTVLVAALAGDWPRHFFSYEDVLAVGRKLGTPPIFLSLNSPALVDTVADLQQERPSISDNEIASLLGVSQRHATNLRKLARRLNR